MNKNKRNNSSGNWNVFRFMLVICSINSQDQKCIIHIKKCIIWDEFFELRTYTPFYLLCMELIRVVSMRFVDKDLVRLKVYAITNIKLESQYARRASSNLKWMHPNLSSEFANDMEKNCWWINIRESVRNHPSSTKPLQHVWSKEVRWNSSEACEIQKTYIPCSSVFILCYLIWDICAQVKIAKILLAKELSVSLLSAKILA